MAAPKSQSKTAGASLGGVVAGWRVGAGARREARGGNGGSDRSAADEGREPEPEKQPKTPTTEGLERGRPGENRRLPRRPPPADTKPTGDASAGTTRRGPGGEWTAATATTRADDGAHSQPTSLEQELHETLASQARLAKPDRPTQPEARRTTQQLAPPDRPTSPAPANPTDQPTICFVCLFHHPFPETNKQNRWWDGVSAAPHALDNPRPLQSTNFLGRGRSGAPVRRAEAARLTAPDANPRTDTRAPGAGGRAARGGRARSGGYGCALAGPPGRRVRKRQPQAPRACAIPIGARQRLAQAGRGRGRTAGEARWLRGRERRSWSGEAR